jgi:uncharacterized SAM-binding protein YcdF (DUF218 family)
MSPFKNRWWRRLAWLMTFCCVLLASGYVFRVPLFAGLARAWVINDPVTRADAIVILGGGVENRPFTAAKLFHEGVAPRILYMNVRPGPAVELGVIPPEKEQTHQILSINGVPEAAMTTLGDSVSNTYDESLAVRDWVEKSGAKSIVIPTDPFHTRRVRWLFGQQLRNLKTEVHVVAVNPVRYHTEDWWRHEEGAIAFQNEVAKYLYYRCKY